eukprot:Protomagalhaensia_sp_Gyna_25__395@NODE_1188_length_2084_cov_109_883619_g944_i0_p2_GENE_NODE_1188_length_2084_cov_109_883619_g944_i0NODE_1188_length_2084_cov_109_883619_g944_i0_p2_ORF_typecomplete_len283_score59_00DUF2730/PF10805_8/4_3e03DUF2730/PF10805_8/0_0012Dynactin_p22/PF07426_11/4_4e03Dynactin_p22/PF07426_11/0_0019DUF2250/PF10007_9/0_016DUF4763/PF15960_5/0_069DUF3713/PF12506_8/36DUF3713/PF12506_8/9_5JAKMIP_CC3/PF16034_5/1_8e03JAKMIP_CC3/PF16034_5/0_6ATG16/PF08614_11/25APG6_N/PF17675_1/2_1To
MQASQRGEKLESMLLVPAFGRGQSYLPSIENPADLKKFVECDLSLSILRRLEALSRTVGFHTKETGLHLHPFWVEPSNRQPNDAVLKLIHDLLFNTSDADKDNEALVREKSNKIVEALKTVSPDVSQSWAQNLLIEMSRLRSQAQILAWMGNVNQKRCRAAILGLDARVNRLQYSLEAPLNAARILEGWTMIESRKTFVLENEQQIRFIADQCRRIEEMTSAGGSLPTKESISKLRERTTAIQNEVKELTRQAMILDAQMLALAERLQTTNQIFTSIVLSLA